MIEFSQFLMKLKDNETKLQELNLGLNKQYPSIVARALNKFKTFIQIDPLNCSSVVVEVSQKKNLTTRLNYVELFFCLDKKLNSVDREELINTLKNPHYFFQCIKVKSDGKYKLLGLDFEQYTYAYFSVHCFDFSYKYEEAEKIAKKLAKLAYKNIVRELNRNIIYKEYLALYKQHLADKKEFDKLLKESLYNSGYEISKAVLDFSVFYSGDKKTVCELSLYIETEDESYTEVYYGPFLVFHQDFIKVFINITENLYDKQLKNIRNFIDELFQKYFINGSTFGTKRIFELEEVRDYETY